MALVANLRRQLPSSLQAKLERYRTLLSYDARARAAVPSYRKGAGITHEQMRLNKILSDQEITRRKRIDRFFVDNLKQIDALQHQIEFELLYHNAQCDAVAPPQLSASITPNQVFNAIFGTVNPYTGLQVQQSIDDGICKLRSYMWDEFSPSTPKNRVESIVTNVQPIMKNGAPVEGANGAVYSASFAGKPKRIVIKREKPKKGDLDPYGTLVHEAFISIKGIGELYRKRPNCPPVFSRVIGLASCNREVLTGTSQWCKPGEGVVVFYEYINGKDLAYLIENNLIDAADYLKIMLLLIYGLNEAYQEIGFTHYDLHAENIIVEDLKRYVPFNLPGGRQIASRYLPKIIDYGYSRIVYQGVPFGYWKIWNGPHPAHSNIIGDIVRYLITVFGYLPDRPEYDNVYAAAQALAKFFTNEDLRSIALAEEDFHKTEYKGSYYYLPAEFDDRGLDRDLMTRIIDFVINYSL